MAATYNGPVPGFSACLARVLLATLLIPIQSARPAKTLFFDDFSGRELDRTHWNVIVTGRTVNNEQQAYVDSPEVLSLENGALVIRPRPRTTNSRPFSSTVRPPTAMSRNSAVTPRA